MKYPTQSLPIRQYNLDGVLEPCFQFSARTGSPWRDLPDHFGHWHRVYVRYNRWSHKGHWARIFDAIATAPDLEYLMVDGSIVRVHQHGAAKKKARMRRRWVSHVVI